MPTDRFPFAVFVRRQIKCVAFFQFVFEQFDLFGFFGGNDVDRREIVVDVHPQIGPRLAFKFRRVSVQLPAASRGCGQYWPQRDILCPEICQWSWPWLEIPRSPVPGHCHLFRKLLPFFAMDSLIC